MGIESIRLHPVLCTVMNVACLTPEISLFQFYVALYCCIYLGYSSKTRMICIARWLSIHYSEMQWNFLPDLVQIC